MLSGYWYNPITIEPIRVSKMKSEINLPDLDNTSYKPLYIQLTEILIEIIEVNNLRENDPLPSENVLIDRYAISRNTVRQAFSYLEKIGRVRKIRGKGTLVKIPKQRQFVRGFQDIEAGIIISGATPSNRIIEVRNASSADQWINGFNIHKIKEMTLLRRVKYANQTAIAIEERLMHEKIFKKLSNNDLENNPIFNLLESCAGERILRVTYVINSSKLSVPEASALGANVETPVFRRIGTYFNQNDAQVMYSRLTFIGDRVELLLEFHREDDNWGLIKTT